MTNNTLIFIDARITGYQKLIDGLPQGAEVVLLSPAEDGLVQINSYLTGRSNLDAIHLISHGSQGALYLGGSVLNADTLAGYTAQLQQLGQALSANGDLLLYGCNVASGDEGMAFITRLSTLTGADVAASTDVTGSAVLGGDAVLEAATGSIEATGVLTVETLAELDTVLLVPLLGTPSSQMSTSNTLANFTVNAGSDRLLVVAVGDPDSIFAPTSVTFNGTAMTLANTVTDGFFANNTIWHLKLGDSISSVTGNIVVTFAINTANTKFLSATAFTAVDQLTPVDSGGPNFGISGSSNAGSSLNVSSQSGDLVLDIFDAFVVGGTSAASFFIGGGQTVIQNQAAAQFGGFGAYVMSTEPGSANVNMSWSSTAGEVRHAAININQAAPNVAPSGIDTGLQMSEDTTLTLTLADFGFSDAADATPNALKAVKISTLPFQAFLTNNGAAVTNGQFITAADISNGLLKFTPGTNFFGSTGIGFQVQDLGGTANGGVDLDPSENFVTISINSVNDTPVVNAGKTFTSAGSLTFTDNTTVNQTLNVSGLTGAISNITVSINGLNHTFPAALNFLLVAPDGTHNLAFMSDAGGGSVLSNLSFTLTDSGAAFLPETAFGVGTYRPTDYDPTETGANWAGLGTITINHPGGAIGTATFATAFNGLSGVNLNGGWKLYIRDDDAFGDTGSITNWSLNITTTPTYTENGAAVVAAPHLTVSDVDNTPLASATVRLTSTQAGDVLAATVTGTPITQTYNAANGTLLLSGAATTTQYQQVVDSVTFSSTSNNPGAFGLSPSRTIEFQVNDGAALTGPLLGSKTDFAVAAFTRALATADLNGDGKLDLVAGAGPNVYVLRGNGDGTFQTATSTFTLGANASDIAIADLNGDGKLDLAVTNGFNAVRNVSVMLGNGDGTFSSVSNFSVGGSPFSVAIADVNGDGKLDLAVANFATSNVSVLLGKGDGTFNAASNFAVGTGFAGPASVAIADLDGDGRPDLVVANQNSANVSVLRGNGDGSFQTAVNFAAGTGAKSVAIADVNGDGKLDLAVANFTSNNVSVLLGNGNGSFQTASKFTTGANPDTVAIADMNGDGKLDLAVTNLTPNNLSVLLGDGNGSFGAATNFTTGTEPNSVVIGDFNGSGGLDVAVANATNATSGNVSVLLNQSTNLSAIQQTTVAVTAVNDAPVAGAGTGTPTYTENGAAVAVAPNFTVSDVDSATLASATVRIAST